MPTIPAESSAPATEPVTRRARKKARTRQEIYRTAMRLFGERGYDGVTIEDICAGADVAKATFFLHFENKAALIKAFNEEVTQTMAERLAGEEGSAEEQLRVLVDLFSGEYRRNAPAMRQMLRDFFAQPALPSKAQAANESVLDLVTRILRHGQKRGELRTDFAAELAAVAIVSTWGALVHWWSERPDIESLEEANVSFLDIALNGLKSRQ